MAQEVREVTTVHRDMAQEVREVTTVGIGQLAREGGGGGGGTV